VIGLTEEEKLVDFSCRLEETVRWLYATAAREVASAKAAELLQRLAAQEEEHLASFQEAFGFRLEDKGWSRPLGAYVRAYVLKRAVPRISSGNLSEILRIAYALEVGTGRFYRRWQEQSADPQVRQALESLIQAESDHRAWVSECHEELVGTPLTDEGLDGQLVDWPEL